VRGAARQLGAIVGSIGATLLLLLASREPRQLLVRRGRLALPRPRESATGLRLAFLTDFHAGGPGTSTQLSRTALHLLASWRPDLVLLGGDYFDQGNMVDTALFDELARYENVFGVLGNHDYRRGTTNAQAIVRFLEARNVRVLRNEFVTITVERQQGATGTIELVGLDDPYTGYDRPEILKRPLPPHPRLLLAHAPSVVERLPVGCADLALFGHTHWGQVRLSPSRTIGLLDAAWYLDRWRHKPHARLQRGWFWEKGMLVYVSAGIGLTQLPFRLFASPEILCLELDPDAHDPQRACDDPLRYIRSSTMRHTLQREERR